jgi:hypothetical protein
MSEDIGIPEGWRKSTPTPQEPRIEWVSIEKLLDEYTIPVLAAVIEGLNVQTHNATGRRILATDGDESDRHSKAFALSHLALRYSMLQDPGPDDDLFYERLEIEGSPLDNFGWPQNALPDLSSVNPHHPSKIVASSNANENKNKNWIAQAQEIAQEFIDHNKKNDLHPSLQDTSEHVAKKLRELEIYGSHQKPMSANSIKRQALQGDWWSKRNTKKIK